MIARARAAQMTLLGEVDRRQVYMADGCRSMVEWATARLDVAPETAKCLVATGRRLESLPSVTATATEGRISFDRAAAVAHVTGPTDDDTAVDDLSVHDVAGIRRVGSRRHRLSREAERDAFNHRYVVAQPNLDELSWRLHARLPGVAGKTLVDALDTTVDEMPHSGESRTTRRADALWQISLDSLQGSDGGSIETATPLLTIYLDASEAAPTNGEAGAWIPAGPRVGRDTLDAIFCDDGCVIAGCTSRYRLQVHHVIRWSEGGPTDASNLATVCWFHHHVVSHGRGYRIDPDSPPYRRRLLPPVHAPPA